MAQTRLFFTASGASARDAYHLLEVAFEDEGLPLAMVELDEARDLHEISVYVEQDGATQTKAGVERVLAALPQRLAIEEEILPDIDWVTHSLRGLAPVRAGRFIIHGGHDRDKVRIGDIGIEIEAGQAFGTGHHGTTSGCLEMMTEVARREKPRNALDLGTGSAVLAIALAKMARIPILATDIDPVAIRVARDNVRLNGVDAWVTTRTATGFTNSVFVAKKPFDLIIANILARPLMRLAPEMAGHVAAGGSLILSGILERQRRSVLAAYSDQNFRHVSTLAREGWVTLHLKR